MIKLEKRQCKKERKTGIKYSKNRHSDNPTNKQINKNRSRPRKRKSENGQKDKGNPKKKKKPTKKSVSMRSK